MIGTKGRRRSRSRTILASASGSWGPPRCFSGMVVSRRHGIACEFSDHYLALLSAIRCGLS